MLKIGSLELENNVILGPMAGVTDLPFRIVCKKYGCAMVCSEMISSRALQSKNALSPILSRPSGRETSSIFRHPANA